MTPYTLQPSKLGNRFADGFVLFNVWKHAVFRFVQCLRLLKHVCCLLLRHHDHAIHIRNDDVSGANFNACAGYGNITASEAVVVHSCRWYNPAAEDGKLELSDLWRIPQASVDDSSRQTAVLHGGAHQTANARIVQAILEDHHIH